MKPTGNVTFLFTDIESSTRLAQDYPDTLQDALEIHHSIMHKAIGENNGFVFEIVGDAFCCSFENAGDAVKAAVEAQINIGKQKWQDAEIKVRIGIHSGVAEWNGKRYIGYITLARTARVMSAAYGEQILVSNEVYELIKNKFDSYHETATSGTNPPQAELGENESESDSDPSFRLRRNSDLVVKNISFRDLGERRLKDLNKPVRIFQILSEGLRSEFPPIKTLDARPNNLPAQLTNFIGREKELKHAKELLTETRLLTLTGSGGAGKTRFSLQTGADLIDDFANGVWFVELASVSDPFLLPAAIINSLGIKEGPKRTPEETLEDYLKGKEILLILDNCEHLINACADITEKLLTSCPKLKIIATSREALNCSGEQTYGIPPLTQPDPDKIHTPEQLTQFESVKLFIERALAVNPKFRVNNENAQALAEVCHRLDGIPLAIELAAARTKVISVEKIFERLDDRFNLLTGGKRTALPRQQTLRALIDWSYDLLTENEKIIWSRLSVFMGGWTLEAAEEVCSDISINKNEILDLLSQLTEKSVIIYNDSKERYRILESIKQYGLEKISDEKNIFLKHLNYFLELSEKTKQEWKAENENFWIGKIEADHKNLISAIEWSVSNGNAEKGAAISSVIGRFWNIRGHYSTGIRILEIILKKQDSISNYAKANVLNWLGNFNRKHGNYDQAVKYYEASLVIRKEISDKKGIAETLNGFGSVSNYKGDFEQAKKCYEESLEIRKEIGDKQGIASSLHNLGALAFYQGDYEPAKKYLEESLDICKEIGDKKGIAHSLNNMGNVALNQGDFKQAKKYLEDNLIIRKEIGDKKGIAASLNNMGNLTYYQRDYEQAKKYYEESMEIRKEIGDKNGIAFSLSNLGNVALNQRDNEQAKKYLEESLVICNEIGDKKGIAFSKNNLGNVALNQGNNDQAKKFFEESLEIRKEIGEKHGIADSLNNLGIVVIKQGDYEQAKKYLEETLKIFIEIGNKKGIAHIINNLSNVACCQNEFEKAIKLLSAAENALESMCTVLEISDQKLKDESLKKLHEHLSNEEFDKYREEGKKLTLEEACQLIVNS